MNRESVRGLGDRGTRRRRDGADDDRVHRDRRELPDRSGRVERVAVGAFGGTKLAARDEKVAQAPARDRILGSQLAA